MTMEPATLPPPSRVRRTAGGPNERGQCRGRVCEARGWHGTGAGDGHGHRETGGTRDGANLAPQSQAQTSGPYRIRSHGRACLMNRDGRTDGTQPVDGDDHDGCNVHGLRAFVPRLSLSQRQDDARGAREPTNPTWNPGALEPWSHGAMAWDFFSESTEVGEPRGEPNKRTKMSPPVSHDCCGCDGRRRLVRHSGQWATATLLAPKHHHDARPSAGAPFVPSFVPSSTD
ncbi:hypothetical protein ACCO45_003343 [Purpureocillium lilacinum]|uniref:Uncharacterized protein n=1 Tax=Purpureocillium lilacinum TaxID=33203 RepID=A0ACC4E2G0_PURLI